MCMIFTGERYKGSLLVDLKSMMTDKTKIRQV